MGKQLYTLTVVVDASQIVSGVLDIARIPATALERMVTVADETERFDLTTATVQNGDTVYQTDTDRMYRVVDDTKLGEAAGYQVYSGAPYWKNIQDNPVSVTAEKTLTVTESATLDEAVALSAKANASEILWEQDAWMEVEGVQPKDSKIVFTDKIYYWTTIVSNWFFNAWTGSAPDDWALTGTGATTSAEDPRVEGAADYSVRITATEDADAVLTQADLHTANEIEWWQGRNVTLKAWVKCSSADTAKLVIDDGVGTINSLNFHSGGGDWELLTAQGAIDNGATKIDIQLFVAQAGAGETNAADFDIIAFDEDVHELTNAVASLRADLADALKRIRVIEGS